MSSTAAAATTDHFASGGATYVVVGRGALWVVGA